MLNIAKDVLVDATMLQLIVAQLPKHYDVRVMNWGPNGIKLSSSRRAVTLNIPSLVGKTYAEVRKILSTTIKSGGFILRSAKPARPASRYVAPANEMYESRSLHGDDDSYSGTPFDTPDVGVDFGIDVPMMEHSSLPEEGVDVDTEFEEENGFPVFPCPEVDMGIGLTADAAYH